MKNIDNILVDTIRSINKEHDLAYMEALKKARFSVQSFNFFSQNTKDPHLDSYLKKTNQKPVPRNSSNRLEVSEMVVIRPGIKILLEELSHLTIPTHIIICSKSKNIRTKAVVDNLNLEINKIKFKDAVDFVPKENFTVEVKTSDGRKTFSKSAFELRNRYSGKFGRIKSTDFLILLDQWPDSNFILSNRNKDLNIQIFPFYIQKGYDYASDLKEMNSSLEKIKNFISK